MIKHALVAIAIFLPIVTNAGLCEQIGTIAHAAAVDRDNGTPKQLELSIVSRFKDSNIRRMADTITRDVYDEPSFKLLAPDEIRAGYIKACYAQGV